MAAFQYCLPRGLGILAFAVLVLTIPSSPQVSEIGAWGGGAMHLEGTGLPMAFFLAPFGKLLSAVPIGDVGFRLSLGSAGIAVGCILVLNSLLLRITPEGWPGLIGSAGGSLLLLATPAFHQACWTRPDALVALLVHLVSFHCLLSVSRGSGARAGLCVAWLLALGFPLGFGEAYLLLIPTAMLFVWRLYCGARWPLLSLPLFLLGTSAALVFGTIRDSPQRNSEGRKTQPAETHASAEGSDASPAGLPGQVWASRHGALAPLPGEKEDEWSLVGSQAQVFIEEIGILSSLAVVLGLVLLGVERKHRWMLFLLSLYLAGALFLGALGGVGISVLSVLLVLCLGVGKALAFLTSTSRVGAPFLGTCLLVLLLLPPTLLTQARFGREDTLYRRLSELSLQALEGHGGVVVQTPKVWKSLHYLQSVEGLGWGRALQFIPPGNENSFGAVVQGKPQMASTLKVEIGLLDALQHQRVRGFLVSPAMHSQGEAQWRQAVYQVVGVIRQEALGPQSRALAASLLEKLAMPAKQHQQEGGPLHLELQSAIKALRESP